MRKIFLGLFLIFIIFCGYKVYTFYPYIKQYHDTIFPWRNVEFSYDSKPVDIYIGDVHYSVPKAYLYRPSEMDGGKLKNFSVRAAIGEEMIPWTLSQSFKHRQKEGVVTVDVGYGMHEDFVDRYIKNKEHLYNDVWEGKYGESKQGIYRDIFTRYNSMQYSEKIAEFYLVPNDSKEKKYLIRCPNLGNPNYLLCTVMVRRYENGSGYFFKIPLRIVEKYKEWDEKVGYLVDSLIVKFNKK